VIRAVLDTTAVAQFGQSVSLGETMAEIADEPEVRIAVPVVCLLEAASQHTDLLVSHPTVVVLPLLADRLPELATARTILGRLDLACALDTAMERGAYILTAETNAYGALGEDLVIEI
jgi:hypothetical protein